MEKNGIRNSAEAIAKKLTLEEKIGMIHGAHLFSTKGVERLGIPPLVMSDGPMGVRQEFEPDCWKAKNQGDDSVTYLPCNSALASTWNRELAEKMGSVLGAEARGRGKDVILAPGINIKRSPLCGRNFEYFSEDPYLTGELASSFIRGVQQWDVAACVKHFAVNNQETQRLWVDVEVDEKALREIYLPAFYDCVTKGGCLSVMGAYNRLYGEHCCQSEFLLNEILRKEWGYDGVVISDWGAVHDTKLAALSQLDIEMSVTDDFDDYFMADPLKTAIEAGEIPESAVDEKVVRILMLMLRLHMLEGKTDRDTGCMEADGAQRGGRKRGVYNTPEHQKTALDVARESIVLLKNENHRLPLAAEHMKKILVVGENARRIHSNGGGSAEIRALYEISPLMGLKMFLGGNVLVDFAEGYDSGKKEADDGMNWQEKSLENGGGKTREDADSEAGERKASADRSAFEVTELSAAGKRKTALETLRQQAVSLASNPDYDAVIFVGGLNHDYDSEGQDRSDMKLPCEQDALLCALLQARPDTVVVMVGGSPVEMGKWIDAATAVVWSYYAGMEGGYALAEVLFGAVNPSGKLAETFYKSSADCPAHCLGEFAAQEKTGYREGVFVGYRYNETFGIRPQFCFGHGLSYTDFVYESANLSGKDENARVLCRVKNAGAVAGAETVQVYRIAEDAGKLTDGNITEEELRNTNPAKELIGFEKIWLEPGERADVVIELRQRAAKGRIGIGSSIEDIRLICEDGRIRTEP